MADPRFLILADGNFHPLESKTANAVVRYHPNRVVAVLDRVAAGKTVHDVLGFGGAIPVVGSIESVGPDRLSCERRMPRLDGVLRFCWTAMI